MRGARGKSGGRKVRSKWSGVGDVVLLSSVMTMVDVVRVICKPRAKSRWTVFKMVGKRGSIDRSVVRKNRMSELVEVSDL